MKLLVMLEDDTERIERFLTVIARHHPEATLHVWRTAPAFIAGYSQIADAPDLVCLDHDLFTDTPDEPDPGDGRDVSDFLISQPPRSPALIHSTNSVAADSMMFSMRDAGWTVDRLLPIGEDWIEEYWYPVAVEFAERGVDFEV